MKFALSALFIISCAAIHLAAAANTGNDSMTECLQKYGLKMDDLEFLRKPNTEVQPMKNKAIEDKVACALACTFKKESQYRSIFPFLKNVLRIDRQIPVNLKKDMLDTLDDCNVEAKGNDCKLLQCIKITRNPFMNLVFSYGA
ncbi:hypothetical protein TSAR_011155 [Trichomalopsis sarcophagae]|uniref:Uncharacterized protein n=1 Tax=Trichomalopsis sarcophagae TaxID=543379 RepID=A0A232FGY5_9HYME|nr:hypothetical protein TSAR_011155 [Trichomalopsis sarcophagae]